MCFIRVQLQLKGVLYEYSSLMCFVLAVPYLVCFVRVQYEVVTHCKPATRPLLLVDAQVHITCNSHKNSEKNHEKAKLCTQKNTAK